jgi:hypothetical protein
MHVLGDGGAWYIGSVVVEEPLQDNHHLVYDGCRIDQGERDET